MRLTRLGLILVLLLSILPFMVFAAITNTTIMTWFVPSNKSHTLTYGATCSSSNFYFVESNGEDSDTDGNTAKIIPYTASTGGSACQSATVAGVTVTNSGNVNINIDANFQTNFAAGDLNAGLKAWMGTGSGCGTNGMGGWQKNCPLAAPADTTTAVTAANCRDFNSANATTTARLVTNLSVNDSNQLCFSGEMTCQGNYSLSLCVTAGTYTHNFDTNAS